MIAFQGVSLEIGGRKVLREVDLQLRDNCLNVLVGSPGSGKTQLLLTTVGAARPTAGDIQVRGVDPRIQPSTVRRAVCFVPAEAPLPAYLSVTESVRFLVWLASQTQLTTVEIVGALRKSDVPDRLVRQRSSSLGSFERLCVWLAVYRLRATTALLIDDPASELNARQRTRLVRLLRQAIAPDREILATTRDDSFAKSAADRLFRLEDGVVTEERVTQVPSLALLDRGLPR